MNIGIYGGTFNPPHLGLVTAARYVMDLLGLDLLYLVPDSIPPHKTLPAQTPAPEHRLELARLAAGALGKRAKVLDLELRRAGKSYTADTVAEIHAMHPDDRLWLLMGADMFLTFHQWKDPGKILAHAGLAAFGRSDTDTEKPFSEQKAYLERSFPQARVFALTVPGVLDISSTDLRKKLAHGGGMARDDSMAQGGGPLLPPAVYGYILRQGLYGTRTDLKRLPLSLLRPVALSHLDGWRVSHVLGVEQEAARLAVKYGADVEQARRAALLHDCTKRLSVTEQLNLCQTYGLVVDDMERTNGKLLHAKTGAALADHVYGLDPLETGAIRWHTTGRADMTTLEKILYIADYIEPSRSFPGVEELRARTDESLDAGVRLGLEMTVQYVERGGQTVHPSTLAALDAVRGSI
ncbi:MAG: bis(5'-nucleosyl)-tetraphosphatase (symmetrical) YqeK [Oscillibacter sp.]|nr:bis(5'-nucleosyl)-tetraphosphatase (symmetrical) YqeK [Oscillibacter sp.]